MALEQVIKCPRTLNKFRDGSLGGLMDGFCDALLEDGFAVSTVRRHLSNISHLGKSQGQVLQSSTKSPEACNRAV